jgi:hypothetical protein
VIKGSWQYPLSAPAEHVFDLFVNSTGFEQRASALLGSGAIKADCYISFLFQGNRELSFEANLRVMKGLNATLVNDPIAFCARDFESIIQNTVAAIGRPLRLGIDVSSMNRTMVAKLLTACVAYSGGISSLELFYVPADFYPPSLSFSPIDQVGPVTPELSGFDSEPGQSIALILGLGYEYGTAVGLINQLEPQITLCLQGIGLDPRFEEAVRQANLDFDFSAYNVEVTEYNILDLVSAHRHIDNIVHSLVGNFRVVLVPMGPKVLASLLVLVGLRYFGKVAVWRVARPIHILDVKPADIYVRSAIDTEVFASIPHRALLKTMLEGKKLTGEDFIDFRGTDQAIAGK